MRKQNWIVNVVLLGLVVVLAMKLRGDWIQTTQKQKAWDAADKSAATPAATALAARGTQIPGAELIVQNDLFSADRNSVQPLAVEVKPTPPEPALVGAMNLGSGPVALMVDGATPSAAPHPVHIGEMIGGYKLVRVGDTFAMVSYEGQEKRVEVQSAPRQMNAPANAVAAPAARPAPQQTVAPPVVAVGPGKPAHSGVLPDTGSNSTGSATTRTSRDMFGPGVQDSYPAGTVLDGWKKVEHPWPFGGKQVWWEKAQQ